MLGWIYNLNGGKKKRIQNFGGKTSCKAASWKAEKAIGKYYSDGS
jgi:hypothetical protein